MSSTRSNLIDLTLQLHHETERAILVSDDGDRMTPTITLHGESVSTRMALDYADALIACSFRTQNRPYSRELIRQAYDVRRQVSEALGCPPLLSVNPNQRGETL